MDALRRALAQFREFWLGLSPVRRFALVAAFVGVFVTLAAVAYLSPSQGYVPVYSDLALDEAGAMRAKLTADGIPNQLDAQGTVVSVPAARLAEAKVALASVGLPTRGGKGYELFDETSLTMTPFVQNVNYQRALQSELARSIMQIEPVKSARVMIARPEPTPFVRDQRPPTASVVVLLKPGTVMSRATAASIVALVSRSVEGLKSENVTVVDSAGRLLSDPHAGDRDDLPAAQIEYRRELERHLASKAEEMLGRHLGAGKAVVRVSADINFQKVKERRKTYSPEDRAVVAERLTTSSTSGGSARGVVGATSNVSRAGGVPPSGGSGGGGTSREEVTQTDYLVSETVRDLEDRMGAVTRLTIAAMADLSPPGEGQTVIALPDAEDIIKQAVGFRPDRDVIKLTNVRLATEAAVPEPDEELARLGRVQAYVSLARNVSLALAVVLALTVVPLLMLRRRARPAAEVPLTPAPAPTADDRRKERLDRLADLARADPDRAAKVFALMVGGR